MMNQPRRLLSLAPNVSMILFALGVDDLVVGRTRQCPGAIQNYLKVWQISGQDAVARADYWRSLPEAGVWPEASSERALALQPNVIFMSIAGGLQRHEADRWNSGGAEAINFDVRTLSDLDRQIITIGEIVGKVDEARNIVTRLAARREAILAKHPTPRRRPTVLYEYCVCIKYDPDPLRRFANPGRFIMVGGHLAPELIRLSGGEPLFATAGDSIAWTKFEEIREAQPDIVIAFDCDGCPNAMKHPIFERQGWCDLKALSRRSVYRPRKNIANPNLCYPEALDELAELLAIWGREDA